MLLFIARKFHAVQFSMIFYFVWGCSLLLVLTEVFLKLFLHVML